MNKVWHAGLAGGLLVLGLLGCATSALPPSETTMSIVQSYRKQLESRVASGHLTQTQARELFYTKLGEVHPPLPDLGQLLEFRQQVEAQVEAKSLAPEQAEARLTARESEMLRNWEEMAARYAREQREIERLRGEYERGYRDQKQMEQTIRNLPPRP